MKCDKIKERLYDYLRAELNAKEHAETDEHIKSCPECAAELHMLAKTKTVIMESLEEPSEAVYEKVMKDMKAAQSAGKKRFFSFRPAFASAALVLLALGFSVLFDMAGNSRAEAHQELTDCTSIFYNSEYEAGEEIELYMDAFGRDAM